MTGVASLAALLLLTQCGAPPEAPPAPCEAPPGEAPPVPSEKTPPQPKPVPPPPLPPPVAEPEPAPVVEPAPAPVPPGGFPSRGVELNPAPAPDPDIGNGGVEMPDMPVTGAGEPESKDYHVVEVFYGTNRKPTNSATLNDAYGTERHLDGPMEYGLAEVSIPKHHQMGVVERPKWYKFEFSENPKKHVVILELDTMDPKEFFGGVTAAGSEAGINEGLLFVHGFNVSWDNAIRRTAQIAFDLDFGGVALSYSWPSQASVSPSAYTTDETNAKWSIPHLSQFLLDLQEETDLDKIHIIAHSMGTRLLTDAVARARTEGFELELNNVILAAPDIDADIFKEQILPKVMASTDRLTMYSSSDDEALKFSKELHGHHRLGLSGEDLVVVEGMDTIDASGIDTSMLGHSYYGSHEKVVSDILKLVIEGLSPEDRQLTQGARGDWLFGE